MLTIRISGEDVQWSSPKAARLDERSTSCPTGRQLGLGRPQSKWIPQHSAAYGGFHQWSYPNSWMVFVRETPIVRNGWQLGHMENNGSLNWSMNFRDDEDAVNLAFAFHVASDAKSWGLVCCRLSLPPVWPPQQMIWWGISSWPMAMAGSGPCCKAFCNGARNYADMMFRCLTLLICLALLHCMFLHAFALFCIFFMRCMEGYFSGHSYIHFLFYRWNIAIGILIRNPPCFCSSWGWKGSVLPYSALFAIPSTIATVSGRLGKWSRLSMLSWRKGVILPRSFEVCYRCYRSMMSSCMSLTSQYGSVLREPRRYVQQSVVKDCCATLQSMQRAAQRGDVNVKFYFGH